MWSKIKTGLSWVWDKIKLAWAWWEEQVAKFLPGFKLLLINAFTVIGTSATAIAAYLKEVDLAQIVNAKTLAIAMIVVSTLSFWLRGIGDRVEDRKD